MKKYLAYICIAILAVSCYKETAIPVKASFETSYVKQDQSVPVNIVIKNKTIDADTFEWSFEGADIESSSDKDPGAVGYSKAGMYKIKLKAINVDGQEDFYEKEITLYEKIAIKYKAEAIKNNYPPVEVKLNNNTPGDSLSYKWEFQDASLESSIEKEPSNIIFDTPGLHAIKLTVSTDFETFTKDTVINVKPKIIIGFDWNVDYFDDDYQSPVSITMKNSSKNVLEYKWTFQEGSPSTSTLKNPKVTFSNSGNHTIKLIVSNGKYEETLTKQIKVFPDTNIRVFENIKFGVNSAHKNNVIGAFFSSELRKVITDKEITKDNIPKIDIAFFGIGKSFVYNKFVSPDDVVNNGFLELPKGNKTKIINSQDKCSSCAKFSISAFDTMKNDLSLRSLSIVDIDEGLLRFDNSLVPRIVLFETFDGRKGAIKIKEFRANAKNSYINCDIKIQKLAK